MERKITTVKHFKTSYLTMSLPHIKYLSCVYALPIALTSVLCYSEEHKQVIKVGNDIKNVTAKTLEVNNHAFSLILVF